MLPADICFKAGFADRARQLSCFIPVLQRRRARTLDTLFWPIQRGQEPGSNYGAEPQPQPPTT